MACAVADQLLCQVDWCQGMCRTAVLWPLEVAKLARLAATPSCICASRRSIYARLRATCDWLAGRLTDADIDCAAYHAGKDSEQRGKVRC